MRVIRPLRPQADQSIVRFAEKKAECLIDLGRRYLTFTPLLPPWNPALEEEEEAEEDAEGEDSWDVVRKRARESYGVEEEL